MSVIRLTKGTKEDVSVDVTDIDGSISDLSTLSPTYTVFDDAGATKYSAASATATGMRIKCRMDTSASHAGGLWAIGHYRLFVGFTSGTQIISLGPIDVYVVDTNIS